MWSHLVQGVVYLCRLILVYIRLFAGSRELQPCKEPPISRLPTEIIEMIIPEYTIGSVIVQRCVPMNFLLTCQSWRVIGARCRPLFVHTHLVVNGHDEMGQFFTLYERKLIHPSITNLTVNLAVECKEEPLDGTSGHVPAMVQIQQDLDRLRSMILHDWVVADPRLPDHWKSLNLEKFSLVVNLSAVSARKEMLRAWTWAWVKRLSQQWRGMGWRGDEGIRDRFIFSYWDR